MTFALNIEFALILHDREIQNVKIYVDNLTATLRMQLVVNAVLEKDTENKKLPLRF